MAVEDFVGRVHIGGSILEPRIGHQVFSAMGLEWLAEKHQRWRRRASEERRQLVGRWPKGLQRSIVERLPVVERQQPEEHQLQSWCAQTVSQVKGTRLVARRLAESGGRCLVVEPYLPRDGLKDLPVWRSEVDYLQAGTC